jgi:hypothetical protein
VIKKTTLMQIRGLDEDAMSYRFVRAEEGNSVEMSFGVSPRGFGSTITLGARYEGSGRILGVPVGGGLFRAMIERAVDRSLPRLDRVIRQEGQ